MKLRTKLTLANLLFKILFISIFVAVTPWLSQRINLYQTDNELIAKREAVIDLIAQYGVEPFITADSENLFASYNILKEEYIVLEQTPLEEYWNYIEVSPRQLGDETIDYRVLNYGFLVDGQTYLLEIGKSLASIANTEANVRRITWFFLLAFLVISSLFELLYTGAILRPLKILTKKISQTDDPEKFDARPLSTTTSDFRVLDKTLHALMEKINTQIRNEKQITQNISHELLTPVSTLRIKLENILQDPRLPNKQIAKIEDALQTLYRLKTLVNTLLKIARIESSQYLKNERIELVALLHQVVEELDHLATDKHIEVQVLNLENLELKEGNSPLLFSMFYNVVNNAIKNTPEYGRVIIEGLHSTTSQAICIGDNGPGIPADLLPHLFTRFKKQNPADHSGSGLGLAITKAIADFHQIDLKVESAVGEGSRFIFALPAL